MEKVVEIVLTLDRLKKDHPAVASRLSGADRCGILSAGYSVCSAKCQIALGRWLVENIDTTRFGVRSGECKIVLPFTEEGEKFKEFADRLSKKRLIRSFSEASALLDEISDWVSGRREALKSGAENLFSFRVILFQWPVFGSAASENAGTPEEYFDVCARQIRRTGGVILHAGNSLAAPPESIVRSLADGVGGGEFLLTQFKKQSIVCV